MLIKLHLHKAIKPPNNDNFIQATILMPLAASGIS